MPGEAAVQVDPVGRHLPVQGIEAEGVDGRVDLDRAAQRAWPGALGRLQRGGEPVGQVEPLQLVAVHPRDQRHAGALAACTNAAPKRDAVAVGKAQAQ